jgi:kynurenine formamidase
MSAHPISIATLEEMASEEKVDFMPGDILVVRTGWTKWYDEHSQEERLEKITNGNAWVGVQGSRESVEWLWNRHFSAVAGDAIGFECWPPMEGYREYCGKR